MKHLEHPSIISVRIIVIVATILRNAHNVHHHCAACAACAHCAQAAQSYKIDGGYRKLKHTRARVVYLSHIYIHC